MNAALSGIRVLDLGRAWSGPLTTRLLADFGAEVIKVESRAGRGAFSGPGARQDSLTEDFPDRQPGARPWNRIGIFNDLNRNKQSLTLDLSTPEGADLFKRLVEISDVVVENYTPRVMVNFKLDYPVLSQINPGIIMLSMPAYGGTGPYSQFRGYGNTIEPVAGVTDFTGYLDEPPQPLGMIAGDTLAALHGVSAVLTALWQKQRTGKGQYLDLSQAETQSSVIGEHILGYQLTGEEPVRRGNRHPALATSGCYRCRGTDEWVVIRVKTDEEWRRFCDVIKRPELANELKYADQLSRWQNQAEIDGIIQEWTAQFDHFEITRQLQAVGIAAGPVLNGRELLADPHLRARGFIVDITQFDTGTYPYAGVPVKLTYSPAEFRLPAPTLGEHNHAVLSGLLGLTDDTTRQLEQKGIIGTVPPDVETEK